jgi:glycosyltransferase involved in cell wall biosynthesis
VLAAEPSETGSDRVMCLTVIGSETVVPQISVIVPVWDDYAGDYLHAALASLVAQSRSAEIIVVDNASRAPVVTEDPSIEIVRSSTRLTTGAARNLGLAHVTAPLVVMWDADDVMYPGTLEALLARFEAAPEAVAHALAIADGPGLRHPWPRRWVGRLSRRPPLMAFVNSIWSQYPTVGATAMRTDAVRATGGCADASAGEDWSLGAALLWRGPVGWSERPGRLYRNHSISTLQRHGSMTHLLERARATRARLRRDQAVPRWCRLLLPLIAAAQYALIFVVRPLLAAAHARSRPTEPDQRDFTLHTPISPGVDDEALASL